MHESKASADEWGLWRQLLSGDARAFEALMRNCYATMYRYGTRFSHDRGLIQDCIQDVFLEIWEKRQLVNPEIPPRPYLIASLRRRIHRANRSPIQLSYPLYYDEQPETITFSVEDTIIETESGLKSALRISGLLNRLPERQKEVIYLRFFQEMSRDEIADIMEIAPQSVSNLLQRALKWLKDNWNIPVLAAILVAGYLWLFHVPFF